MQKPAMPPASQMDANGPAAGQAVSLAHAWDLVRPFYAAFNPAPDKDPAGLLRSVTSEDWVSCSRNDLCGRREDVIGGIVGLGQAVPDLTWTVSELIVAGDRLIVRGEANGTPAGDFIGAPHQGRSFSFMSIDIHTVRNGRIVRTYHVEDMLGAQAQLLKP